MARWIDADALKPEYYDEYVVGDDEYVVRYYSEIQIDKAPSIDIVRCKECKHWRNKDPEQIPTASIMCGHMHPDDYCSYGEREGE